MKTIITFILMLVSMALLDMSTDVWTCVLLKAFASFFFVLTGFFALRERKSGSSYSKIILTGLVFGMIGDVFMDLSNLPDGGPYFIIGLVTFALGHVFYLIAFFKKSRFHWFNLIPTIIAVPAVLFLVPATGVFEFNPQLLFYAVIVYVFVLSFMMGKSFSFTEFKENPSFVRLTIIGAVLFAISDVILFFTLFFTPLSRLPKHGTTQFIFHVLNLLTYYVGQGLIALSLKKEP
ncbi:MAG: lysoplasmalogenase [Treponema sp.]|nr:lysoplasmalogenase [Treponema sp.]